MRLRFTKLHGIGNDFVLIDELGTPERDRVPLTESLARRLGDRRFGIGCDQILWLLPPQDAAQNDAHMAIRNSDGTVARMCGNGVRAAALYLKTRGPRRGQATYRIETLDGVKVVQVTPEGLFRVDMGAPKLETVFPGGEALPLSVANGGGSVRFHGVDLGNPHAVIFVPSVDQVDLAGLGTEIGGSPRFPEGANVEFVEVLEPVGSVARLKVRVWERGAGATLACGSGACAVAVAAQASGRAAGPVEIEMPGGKLEISWAGPGQPVYMTGPAEEVFQGEIEVEV